MSDKKTVKEWVKEILGKKSPEISELPPEPDSEVVSTLIARACGEEVEYATSEVKINDAEETETGGKKVGGDESEKGDDPERKSPEGKGSEKEEPEEKKGCSYAIKRNIVASLQEIRRFAEEHDLAGTMVKALLTMLAEMALGALRGKVSGTVLDALLKVFGYEQALADAYSRGERDGRNAGIEEEYFPMADDGLPHFRSAGGKGTRRPDIFSLADEA